MGTLNPDLLSKDMDAVLNDAVQLSSEFRHSSIQPELLLLALIRRPNTAAARLFKVFNDQRGLDMEKFERQVRLAIQNRRDQNGNLDFIARGAKKIPLSRQIIILLDEALSVANAAHEVRIDTDHALKVLSESSMSTSGLLRQEGITPKAIEDIYTDSSQAISIRDRGTTEGLVGKIQGGKLDAVYFREQLLQEMISILSQMSSRHIILVGPDGVGKRSLAYSLAQLMAEGKGPKALTEFVRINEKDLIDNELQTVRAGLNRARNGILFVPHIHKFFGGPIKAEFGKATAAIQKAFLDDDPIIIATTTELEYNARIANVSSIVEHSQVIRVEETTPEETIEILKVMKPHIEREYDLEVEEEALKLAANLARRYLSSTPLPLSAKRLIHRTAAMLNNAGLQDLGFRPDMEDDGILDSVDVTIALSKMTGVPVSKLGEDERERYAMMDDILKQNIIGQDNAVEVVSRAIKTARVGLKDPKRPIGAFLFLGPTGVGKTELAKQLADFMFGSEDAVFPLDMSEFKEENSVNRLLGSPTGYIGSEDGGQLTEKVRQQPYIIILFDEIEKAHQGVMDILLQLFDEGRLTDGRGVTTRFSEAVIILTSNIGSEYLSVPNLTEEIKEEVLSELDQYLRPEFINRLDEVVMFNALGDDDLEKIMWLLLKKEQKLAVERGLTLTFTDAAVKYLLSLNDEPEYGARPLRRIIRRSLREPLADFLLKTNPPAGTEVNISSSRKKGVNLKFSAVIDGQETVIEL
ncbi:MAG: ATP-dependent Clp protease ATP-binding subunit [Phototrophicaceae bacterium]